MSVGEGGGGGWGCLLGVSAYFCLLGAVVCLQGGSLLVVRGFSVWGSLSGGSLSRGVSPAGHCSGRYASCWNALLFITIFLIQDDERGNLELNTFEGNRVLVGCVLARYMVVGLLDCSLPILYVSFIERYEASRTEASVVLSLLQGAQYAPGKSRVSRQEILSD